MRGHEVHLTGDGGARDVRLAASCGRSAFEGMPMSTETDSPQNLPVILIERLRPLAGRARDLGKRKIAFICARESFKARRFRELYDAVARRIPKAWPKSWPNQRPSS